MSKVKFELEFSTAVSNTNYKVSGQDYSANNKWMNELHLKWDEEGKVRDWMSDQKDADANLYYSAVEGELPIEGMGDNLILFNIAYLSDFALPGNGVVTTILDGGSKFRRFNYSKSSF